MQTQFESKRKYKYTHANTTEKKSNVALLLSDNIHAQARNITRDGHYKGVNQPFVKI